MATHSSVLAWRIPGTVEPGGLLSMGLQSQTGVKRLSSSSSSRCNATGFEIEILRDTIRYLVIYKALFTHTISFSPYSSHPVRLGLLLSHFPHEVQRIRDVDRSKNIPS